MNPIARALVARAYADSTPPNESPSATGTPLPRTVPAIPDGARAAGAGGSGVAGGAGRADPHAQRDPEPVAVAVAHPITKRDPLRRANRPTVRPAPRPPAGLSSTGTRLVIARGTAPGPWARARP